MSKAVCQRIRILAGLLILLSATACRAIGSEPIAGRRAADVLVDLDARDPSAGTEVWTNRGTLGPFKRLGHPVLDEVGGVRAVVLDGRQDAYRGPASTAELEGWSPRTIEAWAYNPWVDSEEETIVSWGKRGGPVGSLLAFGWGKNPTFGAAAHWGADLGWKMQPSSGKWHYLVYTYDGRTARVFDNGVEEQSREIAVNTAGGQPILLCAQISAAGAYQFKNEVTGEQQAGSLSLASLRITTRALSADEVKRTFKAEAARFDAEVDPRWRELYKGKFQYITGTYAAGANLVFFDSPQPTIQDGGDVYSWDFTSKKAVHRLKVDEQGLYQCRAYGSTLYIAGCDATEDWSLGNFYKSRDGGLSWRKYRTIPHAMHVFDICRWQGSLVVGASTTDPPGATVCFSRDDGETWKSELVEPAPPGGWGRAVLVIPTTAGLYVHYTTCAGTTGWKTKDSGGLARRRAARLAGQPLDADRLRRARSFALEAGRNRIRYPRTARLWPRSIRIDPVGRGYPCAGRRPRPADLVSGHRHYRRRHDICPHGGRTRRRLT
jgi:hypothetical protein